MSSPDESGEQQVAEGPPQEGAEQQVAEGAPQGGGEQQVAEGAPQGGPEQPAQQQQPRPTAWQILRSILFQIMIFYFISSFFRGRQQPENPDGTQATAGYNLFDKGQEMVTKSHPLVKSQL